MLYLFKIIIKLRLKFTLKGTFFNLQTATILFVKELKNSTFG